MIPGASAGASVADQLAVGRVAREPAAIERDERLCRSVRSGMDQPGDYLLAGACFPGDQHRQVAGGDPPRHRHDLHHLVGEEDQVGFTSWLEWHQRGLSPLLPTIAFERDRRLDEGTDAAQRITRSDVGSRCDRQIEASAAQLAEGEPPVRFGGACNAPCLCGAPPVLGDDLERQPAAGDHERRALCALEVGDERQRLASQQLGVRCEVENGGGVDDTRSCGPDRKCLRRQGADPRERSFRLLAGARAADDRQHADRALQMTLAVGRFAQPGQQLTLDTINLGGHRGRART